MSSPQSLKKNSDNSNLSETLQRIPPITRCEFFANGNQNPAWEISITYASISMHFFRFRQNDWSSALFWPLVFEYLEPEDLVSVSSVCIVWWRFVFQGRKSTAQALQHCEQLDLADTGKLYQKVPLRFFSKLTWLNLNRTAISSKDFLKLVGVAKHLETLNIESCMEISEQAIFKAKGSLLCLRNINISVNEQFSVLVVACVLTTLYKTFMQGE